MIVTYGCEMIVQCAADTPMISLVEVHADRAAAVRRQTFRLFPEVPSTTYADAFGNRCRRFVAPAGLTTVTVDGMIEVDGRLDPVDLEAGEVPVAQVPDDDLVFLLGSRYCETDMLSQMAWDLFGKTPPGWSRVQAIVSYVHNHIGFDYKDARATRSAWGAWSERVGVCRDYTHLAVALCRCMNIPARYVNGYLGDIGIPVDPSPMDFSAWMEVYLGGRWHTFDPRHDKRRTGRIVVARGRDATDVPLLHSFGPHVLKSFRVWTDEVPA